MSCECHDTIGGRFHGLYRDRDNGMLFGVCAGLAHYFDISLLAVRVAAVISLLLFFMPTVLTYFVAVLLLKERSLGRCIGARDRHFWASGDRDYGA